MKSIKVSDATHECLRALVRQVSMQGWGMFGITSTNRPSIAEVVEVAARELSRKSETSKL